MKSYKNLEDDGASPKIVVPENEYNDTSYQLKEDHIHS